jgi:CDP-diacylglycerol--serine O-phosphatidyltransferase
VTPSSSPSKTRRKRIDPVAVVPTLLTLANLVCGFAAIHFASKPVEISMFFQWSTLTLAGSLIFLGMFFDAIDGSVARLTGSTSDLGKQLDSICDIVTFGVAPAYLMMRLVSFYYVGDTDSPQVFVGPDVDSIYGKAVWAVAAFYLCCGALRLARFNAETDHDEGSPHRYFKGLPIPGAAGVVASFIVLHQHLLFTTAAGESVTVARVAALLFPIVTLLCGLAMVSAVPYSHMVNRYLGGRRDFGALVRIVLPVIAAIWFLQATVAIVCTAYAFSGPTRLLVYKFRRRYAADSDGDVSSDND